MGEDCSLVPDDRADQRAGHRQIAKGLPEEAGVLTDGDVEDLETIALDHRHLVDTWVVCEANYLFGGHHARIDDDVHTRSLEDPRRGGLRDDSDGERNAVQLHQRCGIEVLLVGRERQNGSIGLPIRSRSMNSESRRWR